MFPIVGIGASAGGLSAFESFFSGMPADADPGMAFVLVQHLAPDHKSILSDLIRRYTRMCVYDVEDGIVVEPNCAYIIPPNRDMALMNGRLQLMEPSGPRWQRLPIDFFFRSLAEDQRDRAICIVLSGTGSDGTLGLRAIKGEGGLVMVQSPSTTEYDGMPRSALATGLVDYELPPAQMPAQLIAYVARAFNGHIMPKLAPDSCPEAILRKIFVLLRTQCGHDFSQYKPSTINRRIDRRMAMNQIETAEGYLKYLQKMPAEVDALFRDLLIGVTGFFRDPETFSAIEEQIIPKLVEGRPPTTPIRIWIPGCATGEEAYSIAILLQERMEAIKQSFTIQIFATDIDSKAIAMARSGIYPANIAMDITPDRLSRHFSMEPGEVEGRPGAWRVHKNIRDMLIFSEQDLIRDPPFSKLDLISCRNLLIYMGSDLQKKIIPLFHYALNPGGYLFLGTSETVGDYLDLFSPLDRKAKLYQRKDDYMGMRRLTLGNLLPAVPSSSTPPTGAVARIPLITQPSLSDLTERTLISRVASAAVLINGHGDILYFHGRTGLYLEPAPGEAGVNNIFKMAREGLSRELTTGLHRVAETRSSLKFPGVRVKTNGDYTTVDLIVCPATGDGSSLTGEPLYLVILMDVPTLESHADSLASSSDGKENIDQRIASLQQELRAREEYVQSFKEELETSNEELKSSNEEMQSVNEELQSTNEELETSKEELQSVNEELATVNAELQTKVADLSRVNNDMNNLLAGTGIGTIFVDHQLRILRFTPSVTHIINLILSDVGRPVHHIVSNMVNYDRLVADAQSVLDTLVQKETEVQTCDGRWYTMRILPYRTLENVIEGAVITFFEITDMKKAVAALRESERMYKSMLEGHQVAMLSAHDSTRNTPNE